MRASSFPLGDSSLMSFAGVEKFLGGSCGGRLIGSGCGQKQKGKISYIFNGAREHSIGTFIKHESCKVSNKNW